MVNFEKVTALVAAITAGNREEAQRIVRGEDAGLDKRSNLAKAWVGEPGTPVPKPSEDKEFYTFLTPEDVEGYEHGDIIKHREVGIFNASSGYKAYQMVYRTENSTGFPVGTITTIIVPDNNKGENVVVYPQYEDSSYINCASSYDLLTKGYHNGMEDVLARGWVLSIPDHEGFNSSFGAGVLEGKLTLDSIRALEKSRDITGVENSKYAVAGYSGGSVASGWSAELHESYAPELNIVAVSSGGFVNNLTAVIDTVNKSPVVGFVPAGIMGLASEYPQMWELWEKEIVPSNGTVIADSLRQCTLDNIVQFANQDIFKLFKSGRGIFDDDIMVPILENNTLKQTTPKMPMFIYNGIEDEIVPIESVDEVVEYYCSNGADLVYNRGEGKDHGKFIAPGWDLTVKFFENAFDGEVPSGCVFDGVAPDYADQFSGSYAGFSGSTGSNSTGSNSTGSGFNSTGSGSNSTGSGSNSTGSGSNSSGSGSSGSGSHGAGPESTGAAENAGSYIQPASLGLVALLFAFL